MNNRAETAGSTPRQCGPDGTLRGRTIVLTRAQDQAGEITALLESLGARVVHCPTIKIAEPTSWAAVDAAMADLDSYDWVLFTSSNSVEFFLRRLSDHNAAALTALRRLVKFAIGSATARKLSSFGLEADVVAADSRAEGAIDSVVATVGRKSLRGLKMLLPRAKAGRDLLPDELEKLGASVSVVEAYQTISVTADGESIVTLFQQTRVDAITFTSPSTVSNFVRLLDVADVSQILGETVVACIGPTTAAAAREFGLKNIVQAPIHNIESLVELLVEVLGRRS